MDCNGFGKQVCHEVCAGGPSLFYVNLNIGLKLTLVLVAAYSVAWIVTGIVIGLIYRPLAPR